MVSGGDLVESASQGLTEWDVTTPDGARVPMEWQEVMFRRLQLEFNLLTTPRPVTEQAEDGLRMRRSAYWYLGRLHPDYCEMVVMSTVTEDPNGVVCPMDTGGIWHDKIETVYSPLSEEQKRKLFSENAIASDEYRQPMTEWLELTYPGGVDGYCTGVRPTAHKVPTVVFTVDTEPQAWTWELSVARGAAQGAFPQPLRIHMTPNHQTQYVQWVGRFLGASRAVVAAHLRFFRQHVSVTGNPFDDATARLLAGSR